jgi:hypothetical protein
MLRASPTRTAGPGPGLVPGLAVLGLVLGAAACGSGGTRPPGPANPHALRLERILAGEVPDSTADRYELDLAGRQESLTAACMTAARLRYRPRSPDEIVDTQTNTDFGSLDYAKRYGFGITALPTFGRGDPNRGYLDSLPAEARASYEQQLTRCAQRAGAQADQEYGVAEANREFDRIDDRVESDPRYRAALARWALCAAAAGHPEPSRLDLIDMLQGRLDSIQQRLATTPGATSDEDVARRAAGDPQFQQLRREEISAAVGTFPCSRRLDATYREVYDAIRASGRW